MDVFDSSHLSALVPEELASVLYDLFVRQQTVGLLLTQSEDLPEGDTKRPNVTGRGELTLVRRQGWHKLNYYILCEGFSHFRIYKEHWQNKFINNLYKSW